MPAMDIHPYYVTSAYRVYYWTNVGNVRVIRGDGKSVFLRGANGHAFTGIIDSGDDVAIQKALNLLNYRRQDTGAGVLFNYL